jgi:hypothetical protein
MATTPKSNGDKPKAAPTPLPTSLTAVLPAAVEIVSHMAAISKLIPVLEKQLTASKKTKNAIRAAQAFCVFHRLMTVIEDRIKPLNLLFERYKMFDMPELMEHSGVTSVPLDVGYRVTVSYTTRASVRPEEKAAAYAWLQKNHPDLLIETVNASTLSAFAREQMKEHNKELPQKLFNVQDVPNTSVTKT